MVYEPLLKHVTDSIYALQNHSYFQEKNTLISLLCFALLVTSTYVMFVVFDVIQIMNLVLEGLVSDLDVSVRDAKHDIQLRIFQLTWFQVMILKCLTNIPFIKTFQKSTLEIKFIRLKIIVHHFWTCILKQRLVQ